MTLAQARSDHDRGDLFRKANGIGAVHEEPGVEAESKQFEPGVGYGRRRRAQAAEQCSGEGAGEAEIDQDARAALLVAHSDEAMVELDAEAEVAVGEAPANARASSWPCVSSTAEVQVGTSVVCARLTSYGSQRMENSKLAWIVPFNSATL